MQDIQAVARAFEEHRIQQSKQRFIKKYFYPEELWKQAIALSPRYTIEKIALELKVSTASLSSYKLKYASNPETDNISFVKAYLPSASAIELQIHCLARSNISLKALVTTEQLAKIIQELT